MSDLRKALEEGVVKTHRSSAGEIAQLLKCADRDREDADEDTSYDRRFATAYESALRLATIVFAASGYRVRSIAHHKSTWELLPDFGGAEFAPIAHYFDDCRNLRNVIDYERAGVVDSHHVEEILDEVDSFRGPAPEMSTV